MPQMKCPFGQAIPEVKRLMSVGTDDCVPWPYTVRSGKRSTINFGGRTFNPPTLAWKLSHPSDEIPEGTYIQHSCELPLCVNPHHLFPSLNSLPKGAGLSIPVDMISIRTNECIRWPYAHGGHGYGMVWAGKGKVGTHIMSWILTNKTDVPEGMQVCHTCDVQDCVNPNHFFIGTLQDNKQDEVNKRRHRFGERHPMAKLTEDQVRTIRELSSLKLKEIGDMFGVTEGTICDIRNGKAWAHVT